MKIKKGKNLKGANPYDVALADPFKFLSGLRGGEIAAQDFDPENMNKAAHAITAGNFDEQEIDIARTIREVVDSKILVPRDMKIDDSGIPVAKNVYEWCTNDRFAMTNGEKPYIEQLTWGIITFNEYCPRCSDVEYLYVDHKVDDTYRKLERKVALLEHGVCPHCNWGRSKLIKKGKMKFIQELAVCAGQRSGKSLSIAGYFAPYHTHRLLKLQNPNAFYGLKTGTMLHCTFVALTYAQAKDTLWQNFYATLTESQWFCIAEGTPITLSDGSTKPIERIEVGDEVKTLEGTSTVDRHFDNGVQECFDVQLSDGKSVVGTAEHLVRCLSSDGNSLIWKKIGELTPDDYVVVE